MPSFLSFLLCSLLLCSICFKQSFEFVHKFHFFVNTKNAIQNSQLRNFILYAKNNAALKQKQKFGDLLSQIDSLDEIKEEVAESTKSKNKKSKADDEQQVKTVPPQEDKNDANKKSSSEETSSNIDSQKQSKKKKKKKSAADMFKDFDLDSSEDESKDNENDATESHSKSSKDSDREDDNTEESTDDEVMEKAQPADGLTIEQRIRKEKPPSRVRFAESSQPNYAMMGLEKVSLIYGNNVVLKDSTFTVSTGERIGLVGPNGSGKTTQLKILAGEIEPTTGEIIKSSRNLRVAYLRQEFIDELEDQNTLRKELFKSFDVEMQILADITRTEEEIANSVDDPTKMEEALEKLQNLQDTAIAKGVYALDSKIDKIMNTIGFSASDANMPVKSFSGGWKMRIGLAKILLKDPNILLLDEPTNHLDIDSVFWLENFLSQQSLPMVIVSHDREFLDKVCNKIVDVEDGQTVVYNGNYSKFIEQRRERLEQWREKYEKQLRHLKEEEKWIKKAKNDPNLAQQVKAKESALERYRASEDWVETPPKERKFRFRFPPAPRCGESVVEVYKLSHGYGEGGDKVLFDNVNIQIDRGDRVGFVGPNGAGKSTLMRLILGVEDASAGGAEFGGSNVMPNYFEQNQADCLDLEKTVMETVQEGAPPDYSFTEIRALLGQFMFKGDDVDKKLKVLSGGEKARVVLCKMMLTPANLLLLDEPTNHLDITSKEVLEDALQHFEGSVIVISHDRYFMSQVANKIFSFENKTVIQHDCDFYDFISKTSNLKERVESRHVLGDKYRISNAKEVVVEVKEKKKFGGSGVTSGRLDKGIKNAKRFAN